MRSDYIDRIGRTKFLHDWVEASSHPVLSFLALVFQMNCVSLVGRTCEYKKISADAQEASQMSIQTMYWECLYSPERFALSPCRSVDAERKEIQSNLVEQDSRKVYGICSREGGDTIPKFNTRLHCCWCSSLPGRYHGILKNHRGPLGLAPQGFWRNAGCRYEDQALQM